MTEPTIHVFDDHESLSRAAADDLAGRLARLQGEGRVPSFALTGGSSPRRLYDFLAQPPWRQQVDWRRVEIFWGDERAVPPDSPESNYLLAWETLLSKVSPPAERLHRIEGERGQAEAASLYAEELDAVLGKDPRFDLVLLGLGDDGHVASLFPDTGDWTGGGRTVIATKSPKPPAGRVTLTMPVVNAARHVMFLVSGEGKAEAVARVLGGDRTRPGAHVRPAAGSVSWWLDRAAAARLEGDGA